MAEKGFTEEEAISLEDLVAQGVLTTDEILALKPEDIREVLDGLSDPSDPTLLDPRDIDDITPGRLGGKIRAGTSGEELALDMQAISDFAPGAKPIVDAAASFARDPKGASREIAATGTELVGAFGGAAVGGATLPALAPVSIPAGAAAGEELARQFNEAIGLREDTDVTDAFGRVGLNFVLDLTMGGIFKVLGTKGRKIRAAKQEGSRGKFLSKPEGKAAAERAKFKDLKEADSFIQDSKIYNGGTEYDTAAGKFTGGKRTGEVNPSIETIGQNIDEALPKIREAKIDVQGRLDNAASRHNRTVEPEKQIGLTSAKDLHESMTPLLELRDRLQKNPDLSKEAIEEIQGVLDAVTRDMSRVTSVGQVSGRETTTGIKVGIQTLDDMLQNVYGELRRMRFFEKNPQGAASAGIRFPAALDESIKALNETASAIRKSRDNAAAEILATVGAKDKTLSGLTKDSIQKLQDSTHYLLTERQAIADSVHVGEIAGSRAVNEARGAGGSQTSRIGVAKKIFDDVLLEPLGAGPTTFADRFKRDSLRLLRENEKLAQKTPGLGFEISERAFKPSGQTLATAIRKPFEGEEGFLSADVAGQRGKQALDLLSSDASATPLAADFRALNVGQTQGFENTPGATGGALLPRTIKAVIENKEDFLATVVKTTGDSSVGLELDEILSYGSDSDKARFIGNLMKAFPSLNGNFKLPKSGAVSEFEGKVQAKEDIASLAKIIEEGDGTLGERAEMHTLLFDKNIYKGKPINSSGFPGPVR